MTSFRDAVVRKGENKEARVSTLAKSSVRLLIAKRFLSQTLK